MYRLTAALIILLIGAAVAAAALIQGQPGRSERITGRTDQVDRILAGRGDDVVFARDHLADYVNCGPGHDVAVLDRVDRAIGCETRRYPPRPVSVTPSPAGVITAGPGGSVTPLPRRRCLHRRRGCPPPPPPPLPPPEPEPPVPPSSGPVGIPGSWTLAFADEFGGSAVDLSKWAPNWFGATPTSITKGVNQAEIGCIDPALSTVAGGDLHQRIIAQSATCNGVSRPYRTSLLSSNGRFHFTYGAFEARMFLPAGANGADVANWPQFWSNGQVWPRDGEIDVMEGLGGSAAFNYHYESGGVHRQTGTVHPPGNHSGWHTFAANWQPGRIDYYWDGAFVGAVTEGVVATSHYLIIANVLSSGSQNVVPAEVLVDYVRVWR